MLEKSDP